MAGYSFRVFLVRPLLAAIAVSCLAVASAPAQSLGEAGRKELERRARNRQQGVQATAYGEGEVHTVSSEVESPAAGSEKAAERPVSASGPATDLDKEQARRKQQEEHWRATMASARARVASAEAECNTSPLVLGGG
jgi:hypothetical protein